MNLNLDMNILYGRFNHLADEYQHDHNPPVQVCECLASEFNLWQVKHDSPAEAFHPQWLKYTVNGWWDARKMNRPKF